MDATAGADALLAEGRYAELAAGPEALWQTQAGRAIVGCDRATALAALERVTDPRARLHHAAALWMAGEDGAAITRLEALDGAHATRFLALLRKPRITVLAQLPWKRSGPQDLLGAAADPRFDLQNVSFAAGDRPNALSLDVHTLYAPGRPPDFYLCAMVEWQLVPPNLGELPCPTIGQTADFDLHLHTVHPWLGLFDELIVTDPTERRRLRPLVGGPISELPRSFGLGTGLPPVPAAGPRDIDLFVSGTIVHPYHPEKAKLFHEALRVPALRAVFLNGFVDPEAYWDLLRSSKSAFTFVRNPGATPTRGLETLAMGCATVVQAGSTLSLFLGADEGLFTYGGPGTDLPEVLARIRADWARIGPCARRGATLVREQFELARVASEYLRFATFLAARPRGPRRHVDPFTLTQKQSVAEKGWLPDPSTCVAMRRTQREVLRARAERHPTRAEAAIDLVRETTVDVALATQRPDGAGLGALRAWLDRHPRRLVLHFDALRAALHLGTRAEAQEGLARAEQVLLAPRDEWIVEPEDDVLPYDLFSDHFNYRDYLDAAVATAGGTDQRARLRALLLASVSHYVARARRSLAHALAAADLDPAFPAYTLHAAELALASWDEAALARLVPALGRLAMSSLEHERAFALLERAQARHPAARGLVELVRPAMVRAAQQLVCLEGIPRSDPPPIDSPEREPSPGLARVGALRARVMAALQGTPRRLAFDLRRRFASRVLRNGGPEAYLALMRVWLRLARGLGA